MRLGQGIVSRLPLKNHSFVWFTNPNWRIKWEDGSTVTSHDKGRTRCEIGLENGQTILVQTLHTLPFRRFAIDIHSEPAQHVLQDMADKLKSRKAGILQADFNINVQSLRSVLPSLFVTGFKESKLNTITEVRGHHYDHVLYQGLKILKSTVIKDVLTDHFPIVTTFEIGG